MTTSTRQRRFSRWRRIEIMQARIAGLAQRMQQAGIPRATVDSGRIASAAHLYAPIGGNIKRSSVNIGRHVSPTDVLFEIVGTSNLHLSLNVYAKDLERVRVGQIVRFGTVGESTQERSAKVFLVGQATSEDRMFPVHWHLDPRSARGLRPGMFVRAGLETGSAPLSAVPSSALVQYEGNDYIVVETAATATNHTFRLERVRRLVEQGGYVGIELSPGFNAAQARVVVENAVAILAAIRNATEGE